MTTTNTTTTEPKIDFVNEYGLVCVPVIINGNKVYRDDGNFFHISIRLLDPSKQDPDALLSKLIQLEVTGQLDKFKLSTELKPLEITKFTTRFNTELKVVKVEDTLGFKELFNELLPFGEPPAFKGEYKPHITLDSTIGEVTSIHTLPLQYRIGKREVFSLKDSIYTSLIILLI